MQQIPSDELQAIRERHEKATTHLGKWIVRRNGNIVGVEGLGDICEVKTARFEPSTFHNAEFIAHAPDDISRLLNAYESALKKVEQSTKSLELSQSLHDGRRETNKQLEKLYLKTYQENERLRQALEVIMNHEIDTENPFVAANISDYLLQIIRKADAYDFLKDIARKVSEGDSNAN